jgi:hypothetical protein
MGATYRLLTDHRDETLPELPAGYCFLINADEIYIVNADNKFIITKCQFSSTVFGIGAFVLSGQNANLIQCIPVPAEGAVDPYLANVKFLAGFNGTNGATSGLGFADESPVHHANGTAIGTAQISTAQSIFGGSSVAFDGSGARVEFAFSPDWQLSNKQFTVECRIRPTALGNGAQDNTRLIVSQWGGNSNLGWSLHQLADGYAFTISTGGSDNPHYLFVPHPTLNTWIALAVDFDGSAYRLYVDGITVATDNVPHVIFNSTRPLTIGSNTEGLYPSSSWIDEVRLTVGTARYKSPCGYVVSSVPFQRS